MAAKVPAHWELESTTDRECIEDGDLELGACAGGVHEFSSLTGASINPRCNRHQDLYVERTQPRLDKVNEDWGHDSEFAPAWFDPTACGERWNMEDPW